MHRVLDSKIFEIFYLELFTRKIQSSETRRPHYLALHRIFLFVLLFFVTKSWPVTAPGSQGVFRGRGRGFGFLKNGRQAAIVLSWLLLVQLPGQVLRSYSSKVSKSKRFLIVKQILVYSVTAKLSTEQYLVVRYWFTRMR
jgi:hypothetical protein